MKKSDGCRKLNTFTCASIIQLATWRFCNRFMTKSNDPCGRQFDQMTQAARSGRANIVEGSERAGTSNTTEMQLTDVARASLSELQGDYEFWLWSHKKRPWSTSSPQLLQLKGVLLDPTLEPGDDLRKATEYLFSQEETFKRWLEADDSEIVANALIVLSQRTTGMLKKQLAALEGDFLQEGGFRERMNSARLDERDRQNADPDAPNCPDCGKPLRRCTAVPPKPARMPGSPSGLHRVSGLPGNCEHGLRANRPHGANGLASPKDQDVSPSVPRVR